MVFFANREIINNMKNIELTNKHRTKLRIMCNNLYPETTLIKVNNKTLSFYSANKEGHIYKGDKAYLKMHWFEFCMIYLVKKISELSEYSNQPPYVNNVYDWKDGNKWTFYSKFFFHYPKNNNIEHPVDYLYKQFKTLNNEKSKKD